MHEIEFPKVKWSSKSLFFAHPFGPSLAKEEKKKKKTKQKTKTKTKTKGKSREEEINPI